MSILKILNSRFKKDLDKKRTEDRRKECAKCVFNSLHAEKISISKRILIFLSDFYSKITFKKEEDNLGNCISCKSCSIFYKTKEEDEYCPQNKWK